MTNRAMMSDHFFSISSKYSKRPELEVKKTLMKNPRRNIPHGPVLQQSLATLEYLRCLMADIETELFVAQGFDRVEEGCFPGGPYAENNSD
jgi:hypothetical protein